MMKERTLPIWQYTDSFKEQAVQLVLKHGCAVDSVVEKLGVSRKSIYLWIDKHKECEESKKMRHEISYLKSQLNKVTNERDVLLHKAVNDCLSYCGKPRLD